MLEYTPDDFDGFDPAWQKIYFGGHAQCHAGITGLRSSGIAPFHAPVSFHNRNPSRAVVYAIIDCDADSGMDDNEPFYREAFFEDDYVAGFARYRAMRNARLLVSFMRVTDPKSTPMQIWMHSVNQAYLSAHHGNALHWSDQWNMWAI